MIFSNPLTRTVALIFTVSTLVQACNPDFQNQDITISNGYGGEWTLSGTAVGSAVFTNNPESVDNSVGEFRVEQDGMWPAAYIIKSLNAPGSAISTANGQAHLETVNENDSFQKYNIECSSCGIDGVNAEGCKIILKATGECLSSHTPGDNIAPFVCHPRSAGQFWRFIAA